MPPIVEEGIGKINGDGEKKKKRETLSVTTLVSLVYYKRETYALFT